MGDVAKSLVNAPVSQVLIRAGILFLALAVIGHCRRRFANGLLASAALDPALTG